MQKQEILDLLWNRPIEIAHWVGFKDMTDLHNDWLRSFLYYKDDQTLLAHRGSFKTTTVSVFFAIHSIIRPNENIMFFRKTDTDTAEIIRQTQKILESGCMKYIVYELYGRELQLLKKTGNEITTNLMTSTRGASQILGLGIGTSITGKHASIVATDDIVNLNDRVSKAEREKTKLAYNELQNIKNRGGRFINTGTPWHKEDAISTLMPNIHKYDCYQTGLIDAETLKKLRESMAPSLFAANYELKHIADTDAMFSNANWLENTEANRQLIYDGSAHCDAAYSGEDFTAYTIMKELDDGRIIAYGNMWRKHVDDCVEMIANLHSFYRAGSLSMETNADKGYGGSKFEDNGFFVNYYHEAMNKFIKIASYLRSNWKRIWWLADTSPEYISQILDYTEHAEHDDAPDSAASLLREMGGETYINTDDILKGGII